MHTQHVKFCAYVAWGRGVGGVVAVGVVFVEGEAAGLDDDVAGSVLEVGVVVVFFLPSPSLFLVLFLVVLLDCIAYNNQRWSFFNLLRGKMFRVLFDLWLMAHGVHSCTTFIRYILHL